MPAVGGQASTDERHFSGSIESMRKFSMVKKRGRQASVAAFPPVPPLFSSTTSPSYPSLTIPAGGEWRGPGHPRPVVRQTEA